MDTITLTGVHANGTHGVLTFEHERPQTFVVDVTLHLDLAAAGQSDDLNDTIDYGRVAKDIVAVIEGPHVDLIERLAQRIADKILADAPAVASIDVTVHKPHAPIVVAFADVSVSISRVRATDNGRTAEKHAIHNAVVALGGNVGEVESTLRAAVREIDALLGTQVTGISPLYRTAAWGMADGTPDFLNAVVELGTTMGSHELLAALQNIEANHGRIRENHWDSRPLDLDIIDFDGITSADPDLALPHPRAWQRAFVLAPWAALNPNAKLAGAHEGPVADLLAAAPDRNAVQLESEDWMLGGHAVKPRISVGVGTRLTQGDYFAGFHLAGCRTAVPRNHRFHRQCSWQSGTGHLAALPCQPFRQSGRDERGHPNRNQVAARRPDWPYWAASKAFMTWQSTLTLLTWKA